MLSPQASAAELGEQPPARALPSTAVAAVVAPQLSPEGKSDSRPGLLSRLLDARSVSDGTTRASAAAAGRPPRASRQDSSARALLAQAHSYILLRWPDGAMPRTVMIMCKPTARVMPSFVDALLHCIRLRLVRPLACTLLA